MRQIQDIKIIDKFLPQSLADIFEIYLTTRPAWLYTPHTSDPNETETDKLDSNIYETSQFVHPIYKDGSQESDLYETMKSFLFFVEDKFQIRLASLMRIKANLLVPNGLNDPNLYHSPHIDDGDVNSFSILYYVNDSDGDTFFFNKTVEQGPYNLKPIHKETPKKNTVILFPSKRFHSSSNPITSDKRIVINSVVGLV